MTTKYTYPDGLSPDEKKKFRREARKGGGETSPSTAPPTVSVGKFGQQLKYAYPANIKTRDQKRRFRKLQRGIKASLLPGAPIGPSSTPDYLLDKVCLRCGELFRPGFGEPVKVQPQGLTEHWWVHLGCQKLSDRRLE